MCGVHHLSEMKPSTVAVCEGKNCHDQECYGKLVSLFIAVLIKTVMKYFCEQSLENLHVLRAANAVQCM